MLLDSIIDRAMLDRIIIEILALNPPKNTITAIMVLPIFCGIRMEKNSGFTNCPSKRILPPQAIGATNRLISNKYNGKSQIAVFICFSFRFSIMLVWNCLGKRKIDDAESSSKKNQLKAPPNPCMLFFCEKSFNCEACENKSSKPLKIPYTTYTPRIIKKMSFRKLSCRF